MTKKKNVNCFKAPAFVQTPVLAGCMLKEPMALPKPGGPSNQYVKLRKGADWLCRAVANRHLGTAPLSRTKLLKRFTECLQEGPDKTVLAGDKMQALTAALSKTQKEPAPAAAKKIHKSGKGVKNEGFEKRLKLPVDIDKDATWRLWRDGNKKNWSVWIHKDDLLKFLAALRSEYERKGVDEINAGEVHPGVTGNEQGGDADTEQGDESGEEEEEDDDDDEGSDSPDATTDVTQGSQSSTTSLDSSSSRVNGATALI